MKKISQNSKSDNELMSDSVMQRESLSVKIALEGRTYQGQLSQELLSQSSLRSDITELIRTARITVHDINNSLTAILGSADLGLMQVDPQSEIYENIDIIKKVGSKMQVSLKNLSQTIENIDSDNIISDCQIESDSEDCPSRQTDEADPAEQKRKRILVMDDKHEVRSVVRRILIRLGYKVDTAPDGINTIEKYERNLKSGKKYDAVIMDVNIPDGFGAEVTFKELLKIDPDVNAVVFSGCHNVGIMSNYDKFGFRGCVTKPFTVNELDNIVRLAIMGAKPIKIGFSPQNTFVL